MYMGFKRFYKVSLFLLISTFLASGSAQYLHDAQHHECEADVNHHDEETCTLCLFITNQVSADISISFDHIQYLPFVVYYQWSYPASTASFNIFLNLRTNKDPPQASQLLS